MAAKIEFLKLKERRNELDITQKELHLKVGINESTIKGVETGRTGLDKEHLEKWCQYLGFKLEEIYRENFRDTKVLSMLNNKGGCGKTSVVGNLGYALAELGNKILFIDADMQSNLTYSFGLDTEDDKHLGTALNKEESLLNYIVNTENENIDFVKADLSMSMIEMDLFTKFGRENILPLILQPVINEGIYDYVLIDTNPTLALLNLNVLNCSTNVIIPVQMNAFALKGLNTVMKFIDGVKKYNPNLQLSGFLINNYDVRKVVTKESEEMLREAYPSLILNTIIKVDTTMENAQYNREPVLTFNTSSRIAKEFRELAKEVLKIVK